MRYFFMLTPLIGALVLSACTTGGQALALQGATLLADAATADVSIQSGVVIRSIESASLSVEDEAKVAAAFNDYGASRAALGHLASDPAALVLGVGLVQAEHARLLGAYLQLQAVVTDNWQKYSPRDQALLRTWQAQSYRLETRYQEFLMVLQDQLAADGRRQAAVELLSVVTRLALTVA